MQLLLYSVLLYIGIDSTDSFDIGLMYAAKVADANLLLHYQIFEDVITSSNGSNFIYSPFLLTYNLAALASGTDNSTLQQIFDTTKVPSASPFYMGIKRLAETAREANSSCLDFVSFLKMPSGVYFKVEYDDFLLKWTDFKVQYGSVYASPSDDVKTMNYQVSSATQDRIKELFPPNSLSYDDKLVFGNAIYFKPKMDFTFQDTDIYFNFQKVPGMETLANISVIYDQNEGVNIVILPVLDGKFSLILIDSFMDKLDDFLFKLTKESASELLFTPFPPKLEVVKLPKFRIEYTTDVANILKDFGLSDLFDAKRADFSKLAEEDTYITKMFHKGIIQIDNEGASGPVDGEMHMYYSTNFIREFAYVLVDNTFDTIFLAGKVTDPQYPSVASIPTPSGVLPPPPGGGGGGLPPFPGGGGGGLPPFPGGGGAGLPPTTATPGGSGAPGGIGTPAPPLATTEAPVPEPTDAPAKVTPSDAPPAEMLTTKSPSDDTVTTANIAIPTTGDHDHDYAATAKPEPEVSSSSGIRVSLFISFLTVTCPTLLFFVLM